MRIGIVTMYHNNHNYGGLLQAYALTRVINGFSDTFSEQIQVYRKSEKSTVKSDIKKLWNSSYSLRYIIHKIIMKAEGKLLPLIESNLSLRYKTFDKFEKSIPHSEQEYTPENISSCVPNYDLFITGSDQVWNYSSYNPACFLEFTDKHKISYAASISHSEIPDDWKEKYRELLKDYSAVSVREEDAVSMLQPLSPIPVEWVLDPTLLLSASDWDELCLPRQIDEPYLFCYFLSVSKKYRRAAEAVAKKKGLTIVTLPCLTGYCFADRNFGDVRLWDVSPEKFISLIKYADFVLTDSFHCSAFSTIYRRPFAVFQREYFEGMGGRLRSLTELTDTQDRFLVTPEMATADYICSLPDTLPEETEKMKKMKEKSMNYLIRNIEAARPEQERTNAQ